MCFHYLAFLIATLADLVLFVTQTVLTFNFEEDDPDTETERFRLEISLNVFNLVQLLAWFICQILMLHVFFKFGRPVENDALKLFRNKL